MKKNFKAFVNEIYKGSNKTIGFKYSTPDEEFNLSGMIFSNLKITQLKKLVNEELDKNVESYLCEIEKYNELLELEKELSNVFKTKKKVYQFIDTLNKTSLFEKFMDNYPQCDSRIHPSLDYAGLRKYLKKSLLRENIKIKRKNNNFPKL